MRIHALTTGRITLKRAFLHARTGPRGKLDLFLPGPWEDPVPIHQWLVEHEQHRILVDAGERAGVRDSPFARHDVRAEDELPHALRAVGATPEEITDAILTHLHADHYNGAVHVPGPVLVGAEEWKDAHGLRGRIVQRLSGAPIPASVSFRPVPLDGGPFGAFAASRPLTPDGRVLAVATPGHTVGHLSVIAIDDEGRHVLLAGDTTDSLEQLHDRRADAVAPKPEVQRETIDRILAHAREHPTVYLPSHDRESVARLEAGTTL